MNAETNASAANTLPPDSSGERNRPDTGPPTERVRSSRKIRRAIAALLLVAGACGAWPAYRWWYDYRTEQFHTSAERATKEKSWEWLEAIATRWVQWDPSNNDALVYLAEASIQLGQTERAAESLGKVDDSYPGALEALAIRGDLLFGDLNRVYDAVETWQRMLRINPLADVARQRLIYFYAMTLQRQKMLELIREAFQLQREPPEVYAYYLLAYELNFSDGLMLIRKWRQHAPDDEVLEVAEAVYLAKFAAEQKVAMSGTPSVAPGDLSLINACLKKYPKNLEVLAFHLDKAVYDGDPQRVLTLLSQCPPSAENDPRFWRFRGWYLSSQGSHERARQALERAIAMHPVDWRSRWLLASVLRRLGKSEEASRAAEIALVGKKLQEDLFALPNAAALDEALAMRVLKYLEVTGPALVHQAMARRLL